MSNWLIRWTDQHGDPGERLIPRNGPVDVFDACRLAAIRFRDVHFTPVDHHRRPERVNAAGRPLWTRVDTEGHEIDVVLN